MTTSLRDYLAAAASEADIEAMLPHVPVVDVVVERSVGRKEIRVGLPKDARQIARYMCADAMLRSAVCRHPDTVSIDPSQNHGATFRCKV